MNAIDTLLTVSSVERMAAARARDTLRRRHNVMVSLLANMPVTPQPVSYDPPAERQWMLRDLANYLRQIEEAGEAVAIVLGSGVGAEGLDVERQARIAVHQADHMTGAARVLAAHAQRHGFILAGGNADAAGEAGNGS